MRKMRVCRLRPGMVLAKAIYGADGQLLLNKGPKQFMVLTGSFC